MNRNNRISLVSITFDKLGDFVSMNLAEDTLRKAGFSIGSMQRDEPIGIMFGACAISKWRNLSQRERDELHGQITGDKRNGPVTVTLFCNAPNEARTALAEVVLP